MPGRFRQNHGLPPFLSGPLTVPRETLRRRTTASGSGRTILRCHRATVLPRLHGERTCFTWNICLARVRFPSPPGGDPGQRERTTAARPLAPTAVHARFHVKQSAPVLPRGSRLAAIITFVDGVTSCADESPGSAGPIELRRCTRSAPIAAAASSTELTDRTRRKSSRSVSRETSFHRRRLQTTSYADPSSDKPIHRVVPVASRSVKPRWR